METTTVTLETRQILMTKFAQQVILMPQMKNCYLLWYKRRSIIYRGGLTCFVLGGIISCNHLTHNLNANAFRLGANITPIQQLKEKPNQTTVYVQGKVEKQVPLLTERRVYLINDSTDKIWILTNQTNLKVGDQIVIKGKLKYQSIPINGKEFGEMYIEEQ
jgi:hypothetical protein